MQDWLGTRTWAPTEFLSQESKSWAGVILAIAIIFVFLPVRSWLQRCVDDSVAADDNVKYKERVAFFSNDYDSSNPLTKKAGDLRIL